MGKLLVRHTKLSGAIPCEQLEPGDLFIHRGTLCMILQPDKQYNQRLELMGLDPGIRIVNFEATPAGFIFHIAKGVEVQSVEAELIIKPHS